MTGFNLAVVCYSFGKEASTFLAEAMAWFMELVHCWLAIDFKSKMAEVTLLGIVKVRLAKGYLSIYLTDSALDFY